MATMKDVAERAGVSLGTVSRVINNAQGIKPQTLQKVQEAIEALNYLPDEYARGMKLNKTNTVALIVPTVWHPFFGELAYFVEKALSAQDYKLLLCNSAEPQKEVEYIKMLQQNKVDGIIAITYASIDEYISSNIPFLSIDRVFPGKDIAFVASDNRVGGRLAAEKLIEKGCQHLAFIGSHNLTQNETKMRHTYFEQKVKEAGKAFYALDPLEPVNNLKEDIRQFLETHPQIDGIFAINDFMALDVIRVARSLGKSCPNDYQIIGYDGIKMAQERDFIVSTIKQPLEQMATVAVNHLLAIIEGLQRPKQIFVPGYFVEGPTTKKH